MNVGEKTTCHEIPVCVAPPQVSESLSITNCSPGTSLWLQDTTLPRTGVVFIRAETEAAVQEAGGAALAATVVAAVTKASSAAVP